METADENMTGNSLHLESIYNDLIPTKPFFYLIIMLDKPFGQFAITLLFQQNSTESGNASPELVAAALCICN